MNILFSTTSFYPSTLGGPANTLYWLAKGLVNNGIGVTAITTNFHISDPDIKPDKWLEVDGIRTRYCRCGFGRFMKMIWHTCRVIRRVDWVMLCDMFQKQVFTTALLSTFFKKKIIWSPRGELSNAALGDSSVKRLYLKLVRLMFARTVIFHATSEEERRLIQNHFGEDVKVIVIPNYLELPEVQERHISAPPYLLYLGRIAPIKALDLLVDGLAKSRLFCESNFVFKIAGGVESQFEEYKRFLDDKIHSYNLEERIIFLGPVHGEQKYQLLADSYVMLLVSHSENFGNVVIEALSQGTPVIASKGTPWEKLKINNAGDWIDNTPDEIARSIDNIISLPTEEYQHLRKNALNYGESFDIYKNVTSWLTALSLN